MNAVQCEQEVLRIHRFFVQWLTGNTPNTCQNFASQCGLVLAKDIVLIKPTGTVVRHDELRRELQEAYGSLKVFNMEIRNMQVMQCTSDLCLLMYEEWHFRDAVSSRQCTAVFRPKEDSGGVEWVHIHETTMESGE